MIGNEISASTVATAIGRAVKELSGKISVVGSLAKADICQQPCAVVTVPQRYPVVADNGIAGYSVEFSVSIYGSKLEAEMLKHQVIRAVSSIEYEERRCYLHSVSATQQNSLSGYVMLYSLM